MLTRLESVGGPVSPDALGITMPHEHTFLDGMREDRGDGLVQDPGLVTHDLAEYAAMGGSTIVDCTSRGLRPEPLKVRDAAIETSVTVILGTGFYRHPYLDEAWFDRHSTDEVADLIVRDVTEGIDDTGVRAGIIGEIGCDRYITPAEERGFRAAARAHHETDLTITTHAARWPVGLRQLDLLASEGVAPGRIIIGHCDLVPDRDYHRAVAERGAYVQFDNIHPGPKRRMDWLLLSIRKLLDAGFADRLLLSQDVCLTSHFTSMGGPGYGFVVSQFAPLLIDAGVSAAMVDRLLRTNPAAALSGA